MIYLAMEHRCGCSRNVVLIGAYAIKFPRLRSWQWLLRGLLDNLSERQWKGAEATFSIAPVVWGSRTGLVIVTRRCEQPRGFKEKQFRRLERSGRLNALPGGDLKPDNYGFFGRRLVVLDWA